MDILDIEKTCLGFPHVEREIKWKSDLVFMIGRKMFCLVDLEAVPATVAFKAGIEDFDDLSTRPYFKPAPYFAQHYWVTVTDIEKVSVADWNKYLGNSYRLVRNRLSNKVIATLDAET